MALGSAGSTPFGGHAGTVRCVAFGPAMDILGSGGGDGTIRIWDVASGRQRSQLTGHRSDVQSVAFSPRAGILASGGGDGTVRIWDVASGRQRSQLTGHRSDVQSVAFSPDGALLASGGGDGTVRIWDVASGQQRSQLTGHRGDVQSVAFSPDGALLASGGSDGTARLWDAAAARPRGQFLGHTSAVCSVAFSPTGKVVACGRNDGSVQLWDVASRFRREEFVGHQGDVQSVAFSADGDTLATAGADGTVRLWDIATAQERARFAGHAGWVFSVAFGADDATVASGDESAVRLWDVATGQRRRTLTGHTGPVNSVAYRPAGDDVLASGGGDGAIRLWEVSTGFQRAELPGQAGALRSVAFSPDGTILAGGGDDGSVRLWDVARTRERARLAGHTHAVWSAAFSPDGTTLASAGADGVACLWDVGSGAQRSRLLAGTPILSVAFSPDGATVVTGGEDGRLRLWDRASGQPRAEIPGHASPVRAVAFSPDGTILASGSEDSTIGLWDPDTGEQRAQLTGHTALVWSVAFSPDGTVLATGSTDETVCLWDTATGERRAQLFGHTDSVWSVAFSRDGAQLATAGQDRTIRLWNLQTNRQAAGTGFGASRTAGRRLPGVSSDTPSDTDLLGVHKDVETLADLIAAANTRPPLAIAVIGDWGAGKSSVMLQMRNRIDLLAEMSRTNSRVSAFATSVRQVEFNAWHYSDDNVWAGLVSHLFQALAAPGDRAPVVEADDKPDAEEIKSERSKIQSQVDDLKAEQKRLDAELTKAADVPQPTGFLAWLNSPYYAAKIATIALRESMRDISIALPLLLSWAVLGAAAYAVWHFFGGRIGATAVAAAAVAAPATAVIGKFKTGHDKLMRFAENQRKELEEEKAAADKKVRGLQEQLLVVDAVARLGEFLDDRGKPSAYREYQGLPGQIHGDLMQLSEALDKAREQWIEDGAVEQPPLERIVLYIDDLDRCRPRRVVEVLEAVHLMLAFQLFVVVVAVDARWLIRSLEQHHQDLFRTAGEEPLGGSNDDSAGWVTPIDYLDKIFQIPYVLVPPTPKATADYLRALVPETPPAELPDSGETTPDLARTQADEAGDRGAGGATPTGYSGAKGQPDPGQSIPEGESAEASRRDASVVPNVNPPGLILSPVEVDFMARLGILTRTPRAAKRMVNLYRLVRIGIPDDELPDFVSDEKGGNYKAVQILLGILTGYPTLAHRIFQRLLAASAGDELMRVLSATELDHADQAALTRLKSDLGAINEDTPLSAKVGDYQRWCPVLARHSFHTRDLARQQFGLAP